MEKILQRLMPSIFQKKKKTGKKLRATMSDVLQHLLAINFYPKSVIDVGVAYGTNDLYIHFPQAKYLLIEPLEEYRSVLQKITEEFDAEYILAAAGPTAGKIVLNVHPDLSGSSCLKEVEGDHVNGIEREVPMVTVADAAISKGLQGPYLLKVDVQGAELDIMEGAKPILDDLEVIILEASLFKFFIDGPQFFDVLHYMNDIGYSIYDIFGGHFRPLDNSLGQVDLVFVKENGRFRNDHSWANRQQREELIKKRMISLNPKSNQNF
jgi:FkbM family methyltransferase